MLRSTPKVPLRYSLDILDFTQEQYPETAFRNDVIDYATKKLAHGFKGRYVVTITIHERTSMIPSYHIVNPGRIQAAVVIHTIPENGEATFEYLHVHQQQGEPFCGD